MGPEGIVLADFDNDGKADVAIANAGSNNVAVLINQGGGTLGTPMLYPVGQKPAVIIAEDLNGDNNLDLVVANEDSGNISVLLGAGGGMFRDAVSYPTGRGARSLVAKDFNNDRIPDLAVANHQENTVSILLGNGNGTFRNGGTLSAAGRPYGITAGDYNRDGKMDIAVATLDLDRISVFLGRGDGTFNDPSSFPSGARPTALVTADFNGDDNLDLAVTNSGDEGVAVLLGNGAGAFAAPAQYETGADPRYLAVGDFNLDGFPDLAVSNFADETVAVLINRGDGTFGESTDFDLGLGPTSVAVGDFFNNGAGLDMAVVLSTDNTLTTFENLNRDFPCSAPALHFAQFANGDNVSSLLTLVNPASTTAARGEIEIFTDQGTPFALSLNGEPFGSRKRFVIPPRGAQSFVTNGRGLVQAGSLRVCTRNPIGAALLFKVTGTGATGVGSSSPMSGFLSPVERNGGAGLDTGVAVSNVTNAALTLNMTLRNPDGTMVATATQPLSANGHSARFVTELFGASVPDRFVGTLEATATGGSIAATALRLGGGQFTTLPVTPLTAP
jgi:hypothetical protein